MLLSLVLATSGCRKDEQFTDDPGATLELSVDTVLFDTIFTTLGSVTKRFTIRNRNTNAVRVDILLEGGSPSPFRINVDGSSGLVFNGVEILGEDSAYVFVEATLDANNTNNPLLIEDRILFTTNGNEQEVKLLAWGQDALFYPNPDAPLQSVQGFPAFSYIAGGFDSMGNQICGQNVVWTAEKPIVLLNYGVVDSCNTLTIEPGARIYVHGGAGLWVYRGGRITAVGTVTERIVFQGDRLEPEYQDLPGQWDRIWVNEGPAENRFENVEIRNALIGLQPQYWPLAGTIGTSTNQIVLNNVRIQNCSAAGILSENYRIESTNLLVANCGQYCVALTGGGQYTFRHSTIANYWNFDIRNEPAFAMTNAFVDVNGSTQVREIATSLFVNSNFVGNNTNEFQLVIDGSQPADFIFDHCHFRTDQATDDLAHFPDQSSIFRNLSAVFVGPSEFDLHLAASDQSAIDKGIVLADPPEVLFDLDGVFRGIGNPDLGCYEFEP